jgi:hypothetical protein
MGGPIACIAAVLLGVQAGWQPLPQGGVEYLIQIEPQLLETLKSGQPIQSDVPSYVKDVRTFRVTVGTATLPRQLPAAQGESPDAAAVEAGPQTVDPFLPPTEDRLAGDRRAPTQGFGRVAPATQPSNWPNVSGNVPPLGQPDAQPPGTPRMLEPPPESKPIGAQAAGYLEASTTPVASPPGGPASRSPSEQQPRREEPRQETTEKPWAPLIIALFTLFGSFGANVYLGWITWSTRSRYRSVVEGRSRSEVE